MTIGSPTTTDAAGGFGPASVSYRLAAWIFTVLVLLQSILAGQFLNGHSFLVRVHRAVGAQILPSLALAILVIAVVLRRQWRGWAVVAIAGSQLFLTVVQTGLGFAGRTRPGAAAIHVPIGVAIFGLTVLNLAWVYRRPPPEDPHSGAT